MITRFLFSIILTCCLCGATAAAEPAVTDRSFPFTLIDGEHIALQVTAGDSLTGMWGLDTGGGIHIVSNELFRQLKTEPAGRLAAFQMNGNRADVDTYSISSLGMGAFRENNPCIITMDRLDSLGIDGILAVKFFENLPVTIDFVAGLIIFEDEKSLAARAETGRVVELETQRYRDRALDIFAAFRAGDSVVMEFELDTGSGKNTFISSHLADDLGFDTTSADMVKVPFNGEILHKAVLPDLMLDGAPDISAETNIYFRDNLIYDGVIGLDFWTGRIVTIDIPGGRLIVN